MSDGESDRPVIAVLTAADEQPWPGLEPLEGEATLRRASDGPSLAGAIEEADVLLVTDFRTSAVREAWPHASRLRWVHATSAGVDRLLFEDLAASDVPLTNARGVFDRSIAEYVLGMVLFFAKDFRATVDLQRRRRWEHRDTERIVGRRALIVGAGPIGRRIAALLRGAGMEVSAVARSRRDDDPDFGAVHPSSELDRLLGDRDYIIIAAPLTDETRHMFSAGRLRVMKPSARLINIGRGPIVDTEALVAALRERRIAGAGLDVFEQEPLPPEHPLWDMPHVLISPHMAGDFIGWREALSEQFIENFRRWRRGQPLQNIVDKGRGYVPVDRE